VDRLEQHLLVSAVGESRLCDLTPGATDHLEDGGGCRWPGADPEECGRILRAWLDGGLIEVHRLSAGDHERLGADEAERVLAAPFSWADDPGCRLGLTAAGRRLADGLGSELRQPGH
jgi:hypothetical protein